MSRGDGANGAARGREWVKGDNRFGARFVIPFSKCAIFGRDTDV